MPFVVGDRHSVDTPVLRPLAVEDTQPAGALDLRADRADARRAHRERIRPQGRQDPARVGRRRGRTYVINKRNPRLKARQG